MPKVKRLTTYYGTLIDPFYKFIIKADFHISPYDADGNKCAKHLYKLLSEADKKLIQPNLAINLNVKEDSENSYTELEFKNNWKTKIVLTNKTFNDVEEFLHFFNRKVDNDLCEKGDVHSYPDEYGIFK